MKKLLVLLVLVLSSVAMFAQITSNGKPETLKSFRMGVCKLVDINGELSIQAMTRESSGLELKVVLGDADKAVALLESLAVYKPSKGETVSLNNPSDNTAEYEKLNGTWAIRSRGGVVTVAVSRGELKKMVTAIKEKK